MTTTETGRLAKNEQIKESGKATRARRAKLDCKAYHLKLYPNKGAKRKLHLLFLEAKWLRNAAIAADDYQVGFLEKITDGCPVKTPDGIESRSLTTLGSQMKQAVLSQCRNDLGSLAALKKKCRKVGRLGFVSEVNSINLQQYKNTYDLDFSRKRARVQNIGWVRVRGLHQLDDALELANAKLLQKPDGYYLAVTAYFEPSVKSVPITEPGSVIGIDMGVRTHVTTSEGQEYNSSVRETERLRRLQRKLERQVKGSNNWKRTKSKIRREYQKMDNRKDEFANKLVHDLLRYETVYFQDENLKSWRSRKNRSKMGQKLQHSALGKIKAKLAAHDRAVMVDRWQPTTQWCAACQVKTKHKLDQRVYQCARCGFTEDRDVHAAKNMIILGRLNQENSPGTEESACGGTVRPSEAEASLGESPRSRKRRGL